jgi:hypothetical protein
LNILWDFDIIHEVIRMSWIFTVVVSSAGDWKVVDICLALITWKPRFITPYGMSSAGAETERCRITALTAFWDLGQKVKYGVYWSPSKNIWLKNPPFLTWQLWSCFWW